MKKVLGIVAIALFAFSFASCKKDYKCDCTADFGFGTETLTYDLKDVKKKDAKAACDAAGTLYILAGGSCALQ